MVLHRISGVPVGDGAGGVIGMITEGDLLRRAETGTDKRHSGWLRLLLGPGRLAQEYAQSHARKVEEIMTHAVISVSPETPLAEVVALMEARQVKRLAVLENGRLVGVVSRADLLKALTELLPKVPASAVSDAEIRTRILAEIEKQPWAPRAGTDVVVKDGTVELRGVVTDEREREALRILAENIAGVERVRDRLVWVEPMSGTVIDAPSIETG
jgi:CBS domain protein/BON domain-containing protein